MRKSKKVSTTSKKMEEGSGNIFADIGSKDPEEARLKAQIAIVIAELIRKLRITQAQAASKLGIDQPKVSMLLSGRLRDFSIERLFRFLRALEQDIHIVIRPHKRRSNAVSVEMAV